MEDCRIFFEDQNCVQIESDGFEFQINKNNNALVYIKSMDEKWHDIVIPHTLPTGHQIDTLCTTFLIGKYKKVVISNGIKADDGAFSYTYVKEVVWPDDCRVIPAYCFYVCYLEKISNIDNVTSIGAGAFEESHLQEITWPSACSRVPLSCFHDSLLSKIKNISHLKEIAWHAFFRTKLHSLDLSEAELLSLDPGSLFTLSREQSVPPYYLPKDDWERSFWG